MHRSQRPALSLPDGPGRSGGCHSGVPEKSSVGSTGVCSVLPVYAPSAKRTASRRGRTRKEASTVDAVSALSRRILPASVQRHPRVSIVKMSNERFGKDSYLFKVRELIQGQADTRLTLLD